MKNKEAEEEEEEKEEEEEEKKKKRKRRKRRKRRRSFGFLVVNVITENIMKCPVYFICPLYQTVRTVTSTHDCTRLKSAADFTGVWCAAGYTQLDVAGTATLSRELYAANYNYKNYVTHVYPSTNSIRDLGVFVDSKRSSHHHTGYVERHGQQCSTSYSARFKKYKYQ
jgi:hypothetical protein